MLFPHTVFNFVLVQITSEIYLCFCRHAARIAYDVAIKEKENKGTLLVEPATTRWGTKVDLVESLISNREFVESAVLKLRSDRCDTNVGSLLQYVLIDIHFGGTSSCTFGTWTGGRPWKTLQSTLGPFKGICLILHLPCENRGQLV